MQPYQLAQSSLQKSTGVLEGVTENFQGAYTNDNPFLSSHMPSEIAETATMLLKDGSTGITGASWLAQGAIQK